MLPVVWGMWSLLWLMYSTRMVMKMKMNPLVPHQDRIQVMIQHQPAVLVILAVLGTLAVLTETETGTGTGTETETKTETETETAGDRQDDVL